MTNAEIATRIAVVADKQFNALAAIVHGESGLPAEVGEALREFARAGNNLKNIKTGRHDWGDHDKPDNPGMTGPAYREFSLTLIGEVDRLISSKGFLSSPAAKTAVVQSAVRLLDLAKQHKAVPGPEGRGW